MNEETHHTERKAYADEVTLQDVILSSVTIFNWIKKNFIGLGLSITVMTAVAIGWSYSQEDKYLAELSFMLNDDNNPNISSVSGILGQLGIAPQSGKYNVDKLLEIARSKRIIHKSLFVEKQIGGHSDYLANHLIRRLHLNEKWGKSRSEMRTFIFSHEQLDSLNPQEQFALQALYQTVVGPKANRDKGLLGADYGNTDYIMSLYMLSPSDSLSIGVVEAVYSVVKEFYVQKSDEKNQSVFDLIKSKKDSIDLVINQVATRAAELKDLSGGSFRSRNGVQIALLESRLIGLQVLQEEVIRNQSRAEYALETNTPLIQLLDHPTYPLSPQKSSLVRSVIEGVLLGIVVYAIIIYLLLVYRHID